MISLHIILVSIYLYLPGGLANVGAVVAKFIPFISKTQWFNAAIDFGRSWRGKRLVGEHKVWGAALFGVLLGTTLGVLKYLLLDPFLSGYLILNLNFWSNLFFYLLLSVGAITGDLLKSIVKRQIGVDPHKPWIPFDEIDHTAAAMFLVKVFFPVPWSVIFITIVVFFFIHILSNLLGHWLKIKKVPY